MSCLFLCKTETNYYEVVYRVVGCHGAGPVVELLVDVSHFPFASISHGTIRYKFTVFIQYLSVLFKWEYFITIRAANLLSSLLSSFLKKKGSKAGSSHFNEKLSF